MLEPTTEAHRGLAADPALPLVVDLDGTLLLGDSLVECFAVLLFRKPLAAAGALRRIGDRAAFKRRLAGDALLDVADMPWREDLVALIRTERARGRAVHLVTAADQAIADGVAAALGVFDTATGSDGVRNLKGDAKLAHLRGRFPDGFLYAGDSPADLPLFAAARGAVLCDVARAVAAEVERCGTPVLATLARSRHGARLWLKALRPHQWSKNILLFVPLFVGHAFTDPVQIATATAGFLLLSLMVSGTYLVNDLADLAADRRHPTKRHRPFASGALPLAAGLAAAPLMIAVAIAAGALLSPGFAALLLAYLVLTLAYSFGLKREPLLDAVLIGGLFTLRVAMGAAVLEIRQSPWLLSFSFAFFVSLALAKRHAEVMRAAARSDGDEIAGRGYRGDDWPLTLVFGVGSGLVALVIMLLYLAEDAAPSGFYQRQYWLYAVPVLMSLWLCRIWLLSHRRELDDDPVVFALKDRTSLLLGAVVGVVFFLAI
ncbi:UbiA family prenyltransferase [Rhodoplanes serenus]|uniref:UbiA family prenyltransferase n=1 Tax=Rhodoplanes serenus TaxID=200615 RepID=A0A9X4XHR7_9BRAD|nr:UbiA family prenyltransferase [Rhodoplanes serenus]MTW15285.1 UbiA family prenyltransferase [Rhodoplanes serenus]